MFERFTQAARDLVLEAQVQRRAMDDHKVGTEHLLLALLAGPVLCGDVLREQGLEAERIRTRLEGVARPANPVAADEDDQLLSELGIDVDAIRRSVDETVGPGALDRVRAVRSGTGSTSSQVRASSAGSNGRFDSSSKRVLELSLREALRLKSKRIGPEHIGLGILREGESAAYGLLVAEGMELAAILESWETIARQPQEGSSRSLMRRLRS